MPPRNFQIRIGSVTGDQLQKLSQVIDRLIAIYRVGFDIGSPTGIKLARVTVIYGVARVGAATGLSNIEARGPVRRQPRNLPPVELKTFNDERVSGCD